jgi:hypothetical protein
VTQHRTFKKLVRTRMTKTGESYTAAMRAILAHTSQSGPGAVLATSDAEITQRSGRGWEAWFDALDDWGAQDRTHREIARRVASELDVDPLAWEAQAVTLSYERACKGREVGEHPDGYTITASKTIAVPVEQLFDALLDPQRRTTWGLTLRTSTRPGRAHFDGADRTRVHLTCDARDPRKSRVTVEHARLADRETADRRKASWRTALSGLADELAGGGQDA